MQLSVPSRLVKGLLGVGVALLAGKLVSIYLKRRRAKKVRAYPKNVVILHQFPRGKKAPSASPFALKLETWYKSEAKKILHLSKLIP
jgi:hypothetical protein